MITISTIPYRKQTEQESDPQVAGKVDEQTPELDENNPTNDNKSPKIDLDKTKNIDNDEVKIAEDNDSVSETGSNKPKEVEKVYPSNPHLSKLILNNNQ